MNNRINKSWDEEERKNISQWTSMYECHIIWVCLHLHICVYMKELHRPISEDFHMHIFFLNYMSSTSQFVNSPHILFQVFLAWWLM